MPALEMGRGEGSVVPLGKKKRATQITLEILMTRISSRQLLRRELLLALVRASLNKSNITLLNQFPHADTAGEMLLIITQRFRGQRIKLGNF